MQFLAACFELHEAWSKPEGTFVSHLPVLVDGTCNGIQILSLMSRDAVAGARVNLLPTDEPQDLYMDVAEATKLLVDLDI